MEITLDAKIPKLPPLLEHPEEALKAMREAAARAMSNTLIRHFRAKNNTPSAKGFKRSNFWSQAADSVTSRVEGDAAIAEVRKEGVRLRLKGGTVRPTNGHKALAIPADPSVAGIWPSEYGGKKGGVKTFLLWRKGENRGFIGTAVKGQKEPKVLWWLVSKTTHKPDPSAVPENSVMVTAVERACRSVLRALGAGAK